MTSIEDALPEFQAPTPPKRLYKYLSADRILDVLENRAVRFSALIDTNDSFEVRRTFNQLVGPKLTGYLKKQTQNHIEGETLRNAIEAEMQRRGIKGIPPELFIHRFSNQFGIDVDQWMKDGVQNLMDSILVPYFNKYDEIENLMVSLGRSTLCFSLSETHHSPPMWAHYAGNHAGFVLEFNTGSEWFHFDADGKKRRPWKVSYFDGVLDEMIDNPSLSLVSKTTDWAYEREWRIYSKVDFVDRTMGSKEDPVHLLDFPSSMVTKIILGHKMSQDNISRVLSVADCHYHGIPIVLAVPNRSTHTYIEEKVR